MACIVVKINVAQFFGNVLSIPHVDSSIRPSALPRSISCILIGVVYHTPHSNSERNLALISHLQKNVDTFLLKHPNALVMIYGDFNPVSTGLKASLVRQRTSLTQIVNVKTCDTGILDWTLTNRPKVFAQSIQLPRIGRSDHYAILIKPSNPAVASRA